MIYITYILAVSETYLLCTFKLLSCATTQCACISNDSSNSGYHSFPVSVPKIKITQNGILCLAYSTRYINAYVRYYVYTVKSRCITYTENSSSSYAVMKSYHDVFYIHLESCTPGQDLANWYIPVRTGTYQYMTVHDSMRIPHLYETVHTSTFY